MAKLIPIIVKLDGSQAKAEISSISKGLEAINIRAARQFMQGGSANIDTRQMQDFVRVSKESARINEVNARSQARLAEETAKQVTNAKQSELRQFENAEKSKQRISEISAQNQARINEELARRQTQSAKVGLKVFEDSEKSKQRIAEVTERSQAKQTEIAMRAMENARRRDFQDAQRVAREKAALAVAKESKYGAGDIAGIVGTAISGSTAVAGVYAVIKAGVEYQQSMNMFQAVTNATAAEMKQASQIAIALGSDLTLPNVSAKDAAEAMTELAKGGMTAKQSMDAARGTLLLAAAAGITATQAAEINANALNMFNLKASDSGRVADLLAAAANASSAEITDVAASMQQAGAVFNNAKVPIKTLVALIAEMANAGIKGSDAGTSLKTMLQRLQSPTDEASAALDNLKVKIYDQQGAMLPMREIISQFEKSLKGLSQEQKDQALNTIFGADAVRAATIVIGAGAESYDKMSKSVEEAGAAQKLAEARTRGLGGAWENLKSQAETLGLTIFNSVAPALTSTVSVAANFIGLIGQYPATFTSAAVAIGLLTVALKAVSIAASIQALTSYGTALSGLAFIAQNTIRAMFGLQTALIGLEVTVAAVAGWAALIAIIGGVVYAISEYNQAQQKTAEEHIKGISTINDQINAYTQQKATLDSLQNNVGDLTDKQKTLVDIYNLLDTASKNRVDAATKEKGVVGALADEVDRLNQAKKVEADARLTDLATKAYEAYVKQEAAIRRATDAENAYNQAKAEGLKDYGFSGETGYIETVEQQYQSLRNEAIQSAEAQKTATTEFENLKSALQTGSTILGTTADKLIQNKEATRELTQTSEGFRQVLTGVTSGQENLSNRMGKTNDVIDDQTNKIKSLRDQLRGLISESQARIDEKISTIAMGAKNKAEAIKYAKFYQTIDPNITKDANEIKRLTENEKAIRNLWQPSDSGGGSSRVNKAKKEVSELKQQIEQAMTNPQVRAFFAALSTIEGGGRFTVVGGAKANVNDPRHPGQYGMGMQGPLGWSTASGFWQETLSNWNRLKGVLNLTDFRHINQQLKVALYLFQEAAGRKGLNGLALLAKGNFEAAAKAGTQPWAASPFSTLPGRKRKDFLSLIEGNLSGGVGLATNNEEVRNAERIGELYQRIASLKASGLTDEKLQQEMRLASAELEIREIGEILKLREKLNFEITEPLPASAEDRKDALRVLQEFDRRKESIDATIRNITEKLSGQGISTTFANVPPLNPEEAKQQAEQWSLVEKSIDSFIQSGEQAQQQIAELSAEFDDGLSPLEKFDLQVRMLKESGKLTAEQLDILNNIIPKTREELEKAAAAEWAKKLRSDAKSVSEAIENMADGFKTQLLGLQNEKSPLNDFLRSVEGIKELNLGVGTLDTFKNLFAVGNQIDVEKFAKYVRYWLVLRSVVGDFDASKIDEVIGKLKEAAQGYNDVSTATADANFKTLKDGLRGQLDELQRGGRELTEYEKTLRGLETTYKDLTQAQKNELLAISAEIDARREWNKTYEEVYGVVRDSLQTILDVGWGGFFKSIFDRFKKMLLDMAAELITSKLMKILTGQSAGSSGGGFGDIFKTIKNIFNGGGSSRSNGVTATPNFNPNSAIHYGAGESIMTSVSGASGGIRNWASLPPPASLDPKNFTGNSAPNVGGSGGGIGLGGGIAIASMAATVIGGLIGGRVGNVISSIGSGAGMGAAIGSIVPGIGTAIGAGIGAVGGLIMGLLGGDPKRKIDKKENMPKLQQGFAEALKQLREIAADHNAILNDPSGAAAKAKELRDSIKSGFGIKFESKKYRGIAQSQIAQKLAEADKLVAEITAFADTAKNANNTAARLKPEFASGVYMDSGFRKQYGDFKRRNGRLPGAFTGKDYLPSLLADGELVLNERQRLDVINIAGFDPFKHARIPNYASGTFVAPSISPSTTIRPQTPQAQNITFAPEITIVVEGEIEEARIKSVSIKAHDSEEGQKVALKNIKVLKKNKQIN